MAASLGFKVVLSKEIKLLSPIPKRLLKRPLPRSISHDKPPFRGIVGVVGIKGYGKCKRYTRNPTPKLKLEGGWLSTHASASPGLREGYGLAPPGLA